METVLDKITREQIREKPFPHVVVENALPDALAHHLTKTFPDIGLFTGEKEVESNQRFTLRSRDVLNNERIDRRWREFIAGHVSENFFLRFIELFEHHIASWHPEWFKKHERLTKLIAKRRFSATCDEADILLDAQLCLNTPVTAEPSSVRPAHLDEARKLYSGLYYLRVPGDESSGGDLAFYRFKDGARVQSYGIRLFKNDDVEEVLRIPYKNNTLVLFLNGPWALHGVTPRQRTRHPRQFVNLLGAFEKGMYDISPFEPPAWRRAFRRAKKLLPFV